VGAGWDFDDVRDHYLRALYGIDPAALRYSDPPRYLELSRQVTGEVMAEAFGEWRRAGSRCQGAIVLWTKDLVPGAGWGLLDDSGRPKAAFRVLARTLAPRAVWTTDEGLNGIAVHIGNERPEPLDATLRVTVYRDASVPVESGERRVRVEARGSMSLDAEDVIGRFLDIGWVYRFGPPVGDVVCVSLQDTSGNLLGQAFRFPVGRPLERRTATDLSLVADARCDSDGRPLVRIACRRLAYGVRIDAPGWIADDDCFCVEPGHPRVVRLRRTGDPGSAAVRGRVTALNCAATVALGAETGGDG
jgi:beta-mannosidase